MILKMNKNKEQNIEFNSISSDVQVNRDGGRWKSGVIRNFAVLTTDVEATGHDLFVDKEWYSRWVQWFLLGSNNI